jgi:hypothetical protein
MAEKKRKILSKQEFIYEVYLFPMGGLIHNHVKILGGLSHVIDDDFLEIITGDSGGFVFRTSTLLYFRKYATEQDA